ncbi:hypothetical protein BX600DRAFT_433163 [Xylariales sp. PMI_506]|nr:hypothetical protein BX600DRAFT_433163 [Xylariales sp. PMI_506]
MMIATAPTAPPSWEGKGMLLRGPFQSTPRHRYIHHATHIPNARVEDARTYRQNTGSFGSQLRGPNRDSAPYLFLSRLNHNHNHTKQQDIRAWSVGVSDQYLLEHQLRQCGVHQQDPFYKHQLQIPFRREQRVQDHFDDKMCEATYFPTHSDSGDDWLLNDDIYGNDTFPLPGVTPSTSGDSVANGSQTTGFSVSDIPSINQSPVAQTQQPQQSVTNKDDTAPAHQGQPDIFGLYSPPAYRWPDEDGNSGDYFQFGPLEHAYPYSHPAAIDLETLNMSISTAAAAQDFATSGRHHGFSSGSGGIDTTNNRWMLNEPDMPILGEALPIAKVNIGHLQAYGNYTSNLMNSNPHFDTGYSSFSSAASNQPSEVAMFGTAANSPASPMGFQGGLPAIGNNNNNNSVLTISPKLLHVASSPHTGPPPSETSESVASTASSTAGVSGLSLYSDRNTGVRGLSRLVATTGAAPLPKSRKNPSLKGRRELPNRPRKLSRLRPSAHPSYRSLQQSVPAEGIRDEGARLGRLVGVTKPDPSARDTGLRSLPVLAPLGFTADGAPPLMSAGKSQDSNGNGGGDSDNDGEVEVDGEAETETEGGNPANERSKRDEFLVKSKLAGMTYREIREKGNFAEAESTLRGRFRTLTKHKEARVRKPEWQDKDIILLKKAVRKLARGRDITTPNLKISWKQVADYIVNHGGSYQFGNATCRKRWDELVATGRADLQ